MPAASPIAFHRLRRSTKRRTMAAKPRQELPLADIAGAPSLGPVETSSDLPAFETVARSPLAATPSVTPPRPQPQPARQPPVPAARVQRTSSAPNAPNIPSVTEGDSDRASLPSITSQLRQARTATLPARESAVGEPAATRAPRSPHSPTTPTISHPQNAAAGLPGAEIPRRDTARNDTPVVQNESAIDQTGPTETRSSGQEILRRSAARNDSEAATTISRTTTPRIRRAQITEVTPRTIEPTAANATASEGEADESIERATLSPRQLSRSIAQARPSVQRQADTTPHAETPRTPELTTVNAPATDADRVHRAHGLIPLSRSIAPAQPGVQRQADTPPPAETPRTPELTTVNAPAADIDADESIEHATFSPRQTLALGHDGAAWRSAPGRHAPAPASRDAAHTRANGSQHAGR